MSFSFVDTMGEILNATVKNFSGDDAVIKIYKKDYAGASTELIHTSKLDLQYVGEDIEYKPIRQRKLTWEFSVPDQTVLDIVEDIFLQEEGTYMATLTVGGIDIYAGTAIVDEFKQPDQAFPVSLEIIASDLARLKSLNAEIGGGRDTVMTFISAELQKTGLLLNINTVNEYYPDGGSQGDTDDSLVTNTFDPIVFYNLEEDETDISYEALENILRTFLLELCQVDGEWWLLQYSETLNSSYRQRIYDSGGVYQSTDSYNPELDSGTDITLLGNNIRHLNQGYKKFLIKFKHGSLLDTLIPNWNYSQFALPIYPQTPAKHWLQDGTGTVLRLSFPNFIALTINRVFDEVSSVNADNNQAHPFNDYVYNNGGQINIGSETYHLRLTFKFRCDQAFQVFSPNYQTSIVFKVGTKYLKSDGSWSDTNNAIGFLNAQDHIWRTWVIETDNLTEGGTVTVELGSPVKEDALDEDALRIYWKPVIAELIKDDGENETNNLERIIKIETDIPARETFDLGESKIGTSQTNQHPGGLQFGGDINFQWVSGLDTSLRFINEMTLVNLSRLIGTPRQKYDLNFLSKIDLIQIFIRDSIRYKVLDTTWDIIRDQSKAILLEIKDDLLTVSSDTLIIPENNFTLLNLQAELPQAPSGPIIIPGEISSESIVYPDLTASGTDTDRNINLIVRKFDDNQPSNKRAIIHWWFSNTEYGSPIVLGSAQTLSFVKGVEIEIGRYPDGQLNSSLTDENGELELNLTNALSTPGTRYFHAEIQGQIQVISFTINVT